MKNKKEIEYIFEIIYEIYPNTKTELNYSTDFQFLIAVMLSAQTTDKIVNKITPPFFKKIKKPEDLQGLSIDDIKEYFKSINYYQNKSKSIKLTSEMLTDKYSGKIPNNLVDIIKLPGVGIKTAKVVLSVLYNAPYVGVDTHVHRVCNRIGICSTKTPEETDKYIEKNISIKQKLKIHHSLVLFGRYICTARNPKCKECKINNLCNYYKPFTTIN